MEYREEELMELIDQVLGSEKQHTIPIVVSCLNCRRLYRAQALFDKDFHSDRKTKYYNTLYCPLCDTISEREWLNKRFSLSEDEGTITEPDGKKHSF